MTRSIVADLKQDGFIDYLYFTNYETTDPGYAADDAAGFNNCERYAYAGALPARSTSDCTVIQFGSNDVFRGPVRSNDQLYICGTEFEAGVISSSPTTPIWKSACGTAPDFQAGPPVYGAPIGMPPTNSEMKRETRNDIPADVPRPGCLYTGPTVIKFELSGSTTMMRVISPWTRYTNVTGSTSASATNPAGASNPAACGIPGTGTGQLGGPNGALIAPLDRNLIYVQAVPAVGAANANAPATTAMPSSRFSCTNALSYTVDGRATAIPAGWQFMDGSTTRAKYPKGTGTGGSAESAPYVGEYVKSSYKHYDCRAGDVFIEGQMGGQMTVAADNFVYITGDLTYRNKATDVLGLVGQQRGVRLQPGAHHRLGLEQQPGQVRGRRVHRTRQHGRPQDRRGDPLGRTHLPGAELHLRRSRRPDHLRCARAEVPWHGRHPAATATPRTTSTTPASATSRRRSS